MVGSYTLAIHWRVHHVVAVVAAVIAVGYCEMLVHSKKYKVVGRRESLANALSL
jgi:hypothetical protein